TGKSTLLKRLFAEYPTSFGFSVSNTTRNPRAGEVHGKDYHFLTRDEFLAAIERKEFIEHAEFSGNMYGTTVQAVKDVADSGKTCILDIDVQGVKSVKATDLGARFVFIAPPSEEELEARLRGRGTDDEASIQKRLDAAKSELAYGNSEGACDIKIVNDNLDAAYTKLKQNKSSSGNTIDDLDFPKAVLTRIVKASLPDNIAIQKDARLAVSKASTVFVSYLAATANDCARESGHKTIMTNDVFKALEAVGLGDFIDRLQADLAVYAAHVKEKKELAAKNKAGEAEEEQEAEVEPEADAEEDVEEEEEEEENNEDEDQNEPEAVESTAMDADSQPANSVTEMAVASAPVNGTAFVPILPKAGSEYMDIDEKDSENVKRQRIE
ncbi:guanylate kinase, partial [Coemansia sp. RSA 2703]